MAIHVLEQHITTAPKPTTVVTVRQPTEEDVPALTAIVNEHARQGHLLPRSQESIRASLPTWVIAEIDGLMVGCGSLLEMSPTLVEVRSLAVMAPFRRYGVGGKIVRELVERARQRNFTTVFALTRAVPFFERLGFEVTGRERFPEKVWRDCVICPLRTQCDETAVAIELHKQAGEQQA